MNRSNNAAEWWDYTWNPISGCSPISEGCENCWAAVMAKRLQAIGTRGYENGFKPTFHPYRLDEPSKVRKPSRIAVGLMGDLFHEEIDTRNRDVVLARMVGGSRHTFYLLTKRPDIMVDYLRNEIPIHFSPNFYIKERGDLKSPELFEYINFGISAENQPRLDERVPHLLATPAAHRFVSLEPLLGEVLIDESILAKLSWVIVGAESGPNRRPCKIEWVRSIVQQCTDAGVPVFVKQLNIDGKLVRDIDKFPADLRVRQYPCQDG